MVSAHGQFAQKLSRMNFVTGFYETLLGAGSLETLLDAAALAVRARAGDANVALFILEKQGFNIHLVPAQNEKHDIGRRQFRQWFTAGAVKNISLAGQVCSAQRMLTLGMQASPALLKKISMVAVPLGILGQAVGFVLLWRSAEEPLQRESLESIAAITSGLRVAILAYRAAADTRLPAPSLTIHNSLSS